MSVRPKWTAKFCVITTVLAASIALLVASLPLSAQEQQQQQAQQKLLSQQELERLVAPIALYPDALLAQTLTASTYPLEVVMAARWTKDNPNVKGTALEDAMQKQSWDPSVKGLTSTPQVLAMMSDKLDWTNQLGEAFLAQPDDVQNAIQTLRTKAEATGNLKSSKEQKVRRVTATRGPDYVGPSEYIEIEPVDPDYVYVPVYDPVVIFGDDFWSPGYTPFFWYPPWWRVGPAFGFGTAFFVGPALWYQYNWGRRGFAAVQINTARYSRFNKVNYTGGKNWKFDPAHRKAGFKNANLTQHYGKTGAKGIQGTKAKGLQTGTKGVQSLKGTQTQKATTKVQTHKGVQGASTHKVRTHKGAKGASTHKVRTHKGVQGASTHKVRTHKGVKGASSHKVQTHKSVKGVHTSKGARSGGGGKGGKKRR
jgi:Protein of unknown function (DUF3300)